MGGDSEEGASQPRMLRLVEVLQILRRQNQGGLLLRTRFRLLRIYSTAVRLLSQMYSSSSVATVFPR